MNYAYDITWFFLPLLTLADTWLSTILIVAVVTIVGCIFRAAYKIFHDGFDDRDPY